MNRILGFYYFLLACFVSAAQTVFIRYYILDKVESINLHFYHCLFGSVLLLPFLGPLKNVRWRSNQIGLHCFRGLMGVLSGVLFYYFLMNLHIITVTIIVCSSPLFVVVFSRIWLKERISTGLVLSLLLGFLGVYVAVAPEIKVDVSTFSFLVFFIPISWALLIMTARKIKDENHVIAMFIYQISGLIITALLYKQESLGNLIYATLIISALSAFLIQWFFIKAHQYCGANFLAPFGYLRIIFTIILSSYFFSEEISYSMILGATLVAVSGGVMFLSRKEELVSGE